MRILNNLCRMFRSGLKALSDFEDLDDSRHVPERHEVLGFYDRDGKLLYMRHGGSAVAIDDSADTWDKVSELRDQIHDIAHTHPVGPSAFSARDEATMRAIANGLGRPVRFWVLSTHWSILKTQYPTYMPVPAGADATAAVAAGSESDPVWADFLRTCSGMALSSNR